jgi:hypothetical protein
LPIRRRSSSAARPRCPRRHAADAGLTPRATRSACQAVESQPGAVEHHACVGMLSTTFGTDQQVQCREAVWRNSR